MDKGRSAAEEQSLQEDLLDEKVLLWLLANIESKHPHTRAAVCSALVICFSQQATAPAAAGGAPPASPHQVDAPPPAPSCSSPSAQAGSCAMAASRAGAGKRKECRWEWVLERVRTRYFSSIPVSSAGGGGDEAAASSRAKGVKQMVLPAISSQVGFVVPVLPSFQLSSHLLCCRPRAVPHFSPPCPSLAPIPPVLGTDARV